MDIITYALSKKGIIKIDGSEYKPAAIGENGQIVYKKLPEYTTFRIGQSKARSAGTLKLYGNAEQPIEELYINNVAQELPTGIISDWDDIAVTNYEVNPGDVIKIRGGFSLWETELPLEDVVLQSDLTSCEGMFSECIGLTEAPVIPTTVTNCSCMFDNSGLIKTPVIPNSVTNCEYMFQNCKSLTEAQVILEGVTNCSYMFYGCSSLTEAPVIPSSVNDCSAMFSGCTSLTQAPIIPNSVTNCESMFNECTNLAVIPQENINLMNNPSEGLNYSNCYANCPLVEDYILPSWGGKLGLYTTFTVGESGTLKLANMSSGSVTELYIDNVSQTLPTGTSYNSTTAYNVENGQKIKIKGSFSLNRTTLLIKDIVLQNNLTNCGFMFSCCTGLTEAPVIPSSATKCYNMFECCTSLTVAPEIQEGVTNCYYMFEGCTNLTVAPVIPNSVTNCGYMFCGCTRLTEAPVIPNSVTNCEYMFQNCTSLTEAPVIPNSVTNCHGMFYKCTSLTEAPVIPNSVINCVSMFYGCESLTIAPVIPNNVTDCGNMFEGCTSLTTLPQENIDLMNNPPSGLIYFSCYKGCPLVADIVLISWGGNKVEEEPGEYTTFTVGESGTLKIANIYGDIEELYIDNVAQELPTGGSYSQTRAYTVSNGQKIKIKGNFSLYETTLLIKDIVLQNDLVSCGNMFDRCTGLTKAPVIPSSVTNCVCMFRMCTSLTQAPVIPNSVNDCGNMFEGCTSLTTLPQENIDLMNNPPSGLIYFSCYSNCSKIVKPITYDQIPSSWK